MCGIGVFSIIAGRGGDQHSHTFSNWKCVPLNRIECGFFNRPAISYAGLSPQTKKHPKFVAGAPMFAFPMVYLAYSISSDYDIVR